MINHRIFSPRDDEKHPEVYRLHYSKDPEDPLARRITMADLMIGGACEPWKGSFDQVFEVSLLWAMGGFAQVLLFRHASWLGDPPGTLTIQL